MFFGRLGYNSTMIPRCLAIDYGTVRIGLAVSRATLADPLEILPNNDAVFTRIQEICKEEAVECIIMGISERDMAQKTRAFSEQLAEYVTQPIIFMDETLSSKSVHEKLLVAKKSKRRGPIDHYAAAEFLQNWIDEQE